MRKQRRHKESWFSRLLINFVMPAGVLVALSLGIAACARKDVGTLSSHQPRLVLEEFFAGRSVAYGIFEDRFGNLRRQFRVNLSGELEGKRLILNEEFLYDDGESASRTWTIDRFGSASDGTESYTGRAADVKAVALGTQAGNELNWQYDITLEMSRVSLDVHFDDWIYKQDEDIAINRAFVTKFGVEIGSVTIVFIRGKTASKLWPLSLDEWPRS